MLKKSANSVLASLRPSKYQMKLSEVEIAVGAFPFAKIHSRGERPTRTAECTSSSRHSLRFCQRNGASRRAGVGRVRSLGFLSILRESSPVVPHLETIEVLACRSSFVAAC
jgi:hypothetical protein